MRADAITHPQDNYQEINSFIPKFTLPAHYCVICSALLQSSAHQHHAGEHEAETGHLEDGKEAQTAHEARAQAISLPDRANDQGHANQLPR